MSSVYFLIGRILGKYKVLEHIGHGGMSEVYKGQQLQLHRPVAIKVLHPFLADDEGFVARFQREARIIATLRHPNIVQVFDFDYNAELDLYYMVMEYINGPTLKTRLEQGTLSLTYIAAMGAAIADALDYAHQHGMIHRDVKPANIMFLDDDQPVLTDFGIAKMLTLSGLTASGAMVGTPAYMAPEVGKGQSGTAYSDIYALGVVLYQAISGSLPFNSESPMGIVMQHINDPPPHLSQFVPTIPPALEAVILKAMEKEPTARYNRAKDMATALRQAMNLESPNGVTPPPAYKDREIPVSTPTRMVKVLTPSSAASIPQTDEPPVKIIRTNTKTTEGAGTNAKELSRKRAGSFKRLLRGVLLILGLGVIGGAVGLGLAGKLPPALRAIWTQTPPPTATLTTISLAATDTPAPTKAASPTPSPDPTETRVPTMTATTTAEECHPRGRVDKVEIEPDDIVGPGSSVVSYISLRNTGACAWQPGTRLQFESGELMQAPEMILLDALLPDEIIQIHLPLAAPQAPGTYTSVWQIRQPDETILGNNINISLEVDDLPTATPQPLPTKTVIEVTPVPLALGTSVLTTWDNVTGTHLWEGTVVLTATGGTGNYSFYNKIIREETLIVDGELTLKAQRCDPLELDIWVTSGFEVLHWQEKLPYPDLCE